MKTRAVEETVLWPFVEMPDLPVFTQFKGRKHHVCLILDPRQQARDVLVMWVVGRVLVPFPTTTKALTKDSERTHHINSIHSEQLPEQQSCITAHALPESADYLGLMTVDQASQPTCCFVNRRSQFRNAALVGIGIPDVEKDLTIGRRKIREAEVSFVLV